MNIVNTLEERQQSYGTFMNNAQIAQRLKAAMGQDTKFIFLAPDQQEALDQIASKIGRLLSGDSNHVDSWHDIAGYATLVENRLRERGNELNAC